MAHDMDKTAEFDDALDLGFAELRRAGPAPSGALIGRMIADAEAARAGHRPGIRARLAGILDQLGGRRGGFALAASAVLGLWLGYAQPMVLTGDTGILVTTEDTAQDDGSEPLDMFDVFLMEG